MTGPGERRPPGFVPIGIFFLFGAVMATYAAITLAVPGTFLDQAWKLNPEGYAGLASLGRIMAAPFLLLAIMLFLAGLGWFQRRFWGWKLGVALIVINLAGDVFNLLFRHELLKGVVWSHYSGIAADLHDPRKYAELLSARSFVKRPAYVLTLLQSSHPPASCRSLPCRSAQRHSSARLCLFPRW